MKQTRVIVALGFVALTLSSAAHADAPRCEHRALVRWAAQFPGSGRIKVDRSPDQTRWLDARSGATLLEARCDGLEVPFAPSREGRAAAAHAPADKGDGAARVRPAVANDAVVTLARTGRDAVSLDVAAGGLGRAAVHVLTFDDGSFSVADGRGKAVYAARVGSDGALVVTEAAAVGCGCERTTTPEGRVSERKLPR